MKFTIAIACLAIAAGVYSAPVEESSWSAQDNLLARVFKDSTPVTELLQDQKAEDDYHRVDSNKETAAEETKVAEKAASEEAEWTAKEEAATSKAKELAAEQEKEKEAADKANAEAAEKYADDSAKAASEMEAALAATQEAEAAKVAFDKKMADEIAALEKEGKSADEASKAAAEKYSAEQDKIAADIAASKAHQEEIAQQQKKDAEDLAAAHTKIDGEYEEKMKALKKTHNENVKAFEKEEADHKAHYEAEFKSNEDKRIAAKAALDAEAKKNAEDAKAAQDEIKADYEAKKEAEEAKDEAWHKEAASKAAVVAAGRSAKAAEVVEKANAAEADYEEKMDAFEVKAADAKEADKEYEGAMEASKEMQDEMDKEGEESRAADEEIVNCGDDKCLDPADEKTCHVAANMTCAMKDEDESTWPAGPYFSKVDMVHCTSDKSMVNFDCPEDGVNWAGIAAAPTMAPLPEPNATCISAMGSLPAIVKEALAAHKADESSCPLLYFSCSPAMGGHMADGTTSVELKANLDAFFGAMAVCPPICFPSTDTHLNNGAQDTHGICSEGAMFSQMQEMFDDMPIYKASGTNGRFAAGNDPAALCNATHGVIDGLLAGAHIHG